MKSSKSLQIDDDLKMYVAWERSWNPRLFAG
jgi:hypothetical protein